MTKALTGKRIMLAASRKTEEMCVLIEKQGGTAIVRPLQGVVFLAEQEVRMGIKQIVEQGPDWFILTTGIGTEALLKVAEEIGVQGAFVEVLGQAKLAVRGYKTKNVLGKIGLKPEVVDDDGTTQGVIRALEPYNLTGQRVWVQLHGDPAPKLIAFLQDKGAIVEEILPYQHVAPQAAIVEQACREILHGEVDAVGFTSTPQVRFLMEYAHQHGVYEELIAAFEQRVVAVAVGKVTAEALYDEGISRVVAPELERMGAMVIKLAQYYQ
jgi:uroporphyrinogen-III synthase